MLKPRFGQPGPAVTAMTRMAPIGRRCDKDDRRTMLNLATHLTDLFFTVDIIDMCKFKWYGSVLKAVQYEPRSSSC